MKQPVMSSCKTSLLVMSLVMGSSASATLTTSGIVYPVLPGVNDPFFVGDGGSGSFVLDNTPGIMNFGAGTTSIGRKVGAVDGHGSATVTGVLSVFRPKKTYLGIGGNSSGQIHVLDGGRVAALNNSMYVGYSDLATGRVTVDGLSSVLDITKNLNIGYKGKSGDLVVTNGGYALAAGEITAGYGINAPGNITTGLIEVKGSTLDGGGGTVASRLYTPDKLVIGRRLGGKGVVKVSDGGSVVSGDRIYVARSNGGDGQLEITTAGTAKGRFITMGRDAGATGKLMLSGAGSTLEIVRDFINGGAGTGTTQIAGGAQVFIHDDFFQNNSSTTQFGLSNAYLSPGFWAFEVTDEVSLNGILSVFDGGATLAPNQDYQFMKVGGIVAGTFAGLPADGAWVGSVSGYGVFIDYHGGDGNDIVLYTKDANSEPNSIPEPMNLALAGMGILAVGKSAKRRG